MKPKNNLYIGVILVTLILSLGVGLTASEKATVAQNRSAVQAPKFQVDPFWPKPLPNHWILGSVTGVAVDRQDHIWITHRGAASLANNEKGGILNPPTGCCVPAPPVLEFDQAGNLVSHWGGPQGYEWPQSTGGITVDHKGNVWIAAASQPEPAAGRAGDVAPRAPQDGYAIKLSRTGQFLFEIGHASKVKGSEGKPALNRPANVTIEPYANEIYVADTGNRRIAVFDADTGNYKRDWGAYGEQPDYAGVGPYDPAAPPVKQFRAVSSVAVATDGLVYVGDRSSNRIQVFQKDGKFVKEALISKSTLGDGSVWAVAFSHEPTQRYLYVADGQDKKVLIVRRDTLEVVTSLGDGGRQPGQFYSVGSIAVDSKGNIYTGESSEGKRVQKFIYKGQAAIR